MYDFFGIAPRLNGDVYRRFPLTGIGLGDSFWAIFEQKFPDGR
jgi:hypothetical protein